jgi:hypothetical protein
MGGSKSSSPFSAIGLLKLASGKTWTLPVMVLSIGMLCTDLGLDFLTLLLSGFYQVALWLGLNGLRPQGLKEYSDSCSTLDYLGPVLGSKCLVTQTTGDYFGLGPSEETSEKMSQVTTWTFNPLYCLPYMYTYWSHFSS